MAARRVAVRHTFVTVAYEIVSSTPKTHQARVIDLDTVDHLVAHRDRQAVEKAEWGADYEDGGLVFCRES